MLSKETERWLRALGIAKILFEDQGYHCLHLENIENFIRRKSMYSPKIREELIPKIYRVAKAKRTKMTTLVNEILERALNGGDEFAARKISPDGQGSPLLEDDGRGSERT